MNDNDCRPGFEAWLATCGKNPLMWNTSDAMLAAWAAAPRAQREALVGAVRLLTKARRYVEQDHPDGIHSYQPNSISGDLLGEIDAFLARNIQAEQQVAHQRAQAGKGVRHE